MDEVTLVDWIRRQAASMGELSLNVPVGGGLTTTKAPADSKSPLPTDWKPGMPFGKTAFVEKNDPLPRLVFTVVDQLNADVPDKMDHAISKFSATYTVVDGSISQQSLSDGWYFTARSKPPVPHYPEAYWMFAHREIGGTAYRIETTGALRQEELDTAVALVLSLTEADPDDFEPQLASNAVAERQSEGALPAISPRSQIRSLKMQVCGLEEQLAAATRRAEEAEAREAMLEVRLQRLAIFETLATNMAKTVDAIGMGFHKQVPAAYDGNQLSTRTPQAPSQSPSSTPFSPAPTPAHADERGQGAQLHQRV